MALTELEFGGGGGLAKNSTKADKYRYPVRL